MPANVAVPVGIAAGQQLLKGGQGQTTAQLPQDLQGMRQQQLGLLQYFMGFGGNPQQPGFRSDQNQHANDAMHKVFGDKWNLNPTTPYANGGGMPQGGGQGGPGRPNFSMGGPGGGMPGIPSGGAQGGMNGGQMNNTGLPKSDAQQRLESFFGPLGIQSTPLQQQSTGGMSQFLASNPYQQAQTALNGILGNPGEAFRPDFERSLAQANQSGGRFGSANALLRSNALNDYNSAALKNQLGAAQGIQGLGAQQSADYNNAYNMGTAQANQQASGQQQALQLLLSQLQTAQSATLGGPTSTSPSGGQQFAQTLGGIAQLLPFLQAQGGGGGGAPNSANINPYYQGPGFG